MNLRLDWCSYEAAKYAVMNWHYSKRMPISKLVKIGAWENERFIGAIIFGISANIYMGKQFGVSNTESCELVRVALSKHETPTTKIVSIALRMLNKSQPRLKCVVSYADKNEGHRGVIYTAGNWDYIGEVKSKDVFLLNGKILQDRTVNGSHFNRVGGSHPLKNIMPKQKQLGKNKFVYWFDKSAREVFMQKHLLSSKRGGTIPTHALHSK